jgi:hypothetical protein
VIEGGNDRGHLQCGHGLPDVIKDLDTLMITPGPCPFSYPPTVCRRRSATAYRDFASALVTGPGQLVEPDTPRNLAVDLAEALEAIDAVEQCDAVEVADEWFHDQPAPELPDAGADSGRPDTDH